MAKRKEAAKKPVGKYVLGAAAAIFVGSILWSMWAETLLPLIRAGDTRAVWLHVVGLGFLLIAAGGLLINL